jgi:hypothetical protein
MKRMLFILLACAMVIVVAATVGSLLLLQNSSKPQTGVTQKTSKARKPTSFTVGERAIVVFPGATAMW